MSSVEKAYGVIKSVMLANERFDAIDENLKALAGDLDALARSHADLAERVARVEGFLQGAAAASPRNTGQIEEK